MGLRIKSTAWCRWSHECHRRGDWDVTLHATPSKDAIVTILVRDMWLKHAITASETVWCEFRHSHEVGARSAIESFWTKQALEVLRGPLVTMLARYMRLKIDFSSTNFKEIFRARLVTSRDLVEKTFNRISRANSVTVVALPTYPRLRQKKIQ